MGSEDIKGAFLSYMRAYFQERSLERTSAMFHPDMTCIGTGQDEKAWSLEDATKLYHRDFEQAAGPIKVEYLFLDAFLLSEDSGLAVSEINISGVIQEQPFIMNGLRLTAVFTGGKREWRLAHMHISLPTEVHETGEAYPLKEIEERNRLLQEMVEEKTAELQRKNHELEMALLQIKTLSGLLPICANCKKIRDDAGYWRQVEDYIVRHSDVRFSHGICPDCIRKLYPDIASDILNEQDEKDEQ